MKKSIIKMIHILSFLSFIFSIHSPSIKEKVIEKNTVSIEFPKFDYPLKKFIVSSPFAIRQYKGKVSIHTGIDLVAEKGSKVMAVADGITVLYYPPPDGRFKGHPVYGGCILLEHGNGIYSLYAHLSKTNCVNGQVFKKGDTIGVIGETGVATGIHLHLEIVIDPLNLIIEDLKRYK